MGIKLYAANKEHVIYYLLILLAVGIPFSANLDKLAVILSAIALIYFFARKSVNFKHPIKLRKLYPPLAYILMMILGVIYSTNQSLAWQKIESSIPLLILPLFSFFCLSGAASHKQMLKILVAFSLASLFSILFACVSLALKAPFQPQEASDFFSIYSRDFLAGELGIHPIYISLVHAFNIQVLMFFLFDGKTNIKLKTKVFWTFCLISSLAFIILLGAKMSFIAAAFTILLWIIRFIVLNKKYFYGAFLLVLFPVLIVTAIIYVPNINKRFIEVQDTELVPPQGKAHNSTNLRVGQVLCSLEVIKNNLLLGTGTGDYNLALNSCYKENGYSSVLYLDSYNSHNQYLQTWLMLGIFGFMSLIAILLYPFVYALRNSDWLVISLLVIFIFAFLTESVLQSSKGVILFSFCYSIYILRSSYLEKNRKA